LEQEETGWKLVNGDVFRLPENKELLCAVLGNGTQLMCMCLGVLFLACLGCVCAHACVCVHACVYVHACMCMRVCACVYVHACMCMRACACACVCACACACM